MTPERRVFRLVVAGLILVVVALIGAVLSQLERRTLEIEVGPSEEGRRNPFLAAERFLARLEIPVSSDSGRERLRRLPPPTDTLVVRYPGSLAPERRRALDQWMTDGGRLVVAASESGPGAAEEDDLVAAYGVRLSTADADRPAVDGQTDVIAAIPVEHPGRPLRVAFSTERSLVTTAEPETAVIAGARLGPLQPVPSRDRRDLLEHLGASGGFLWRHGQSDHLIKPTRRRVIELWRRRRPDLGRLDDAALAHAIAVATGEDPDAVVRALHVHAEDADAFVRQSALLQRLWRKASIR
ncbi:DUF4350 domain-containing protein [Thiocapsa sp.]|uniref:DUF4350 domain-containing protein n=1 Tax=Thiocapsa sp. TaxID=2024551 RepID=UPI002BBA78E6|nr:DUF4350 domain-containing protein [Thiocapsa sp.]HSO81837.1 DUF4350 domain-containing protein [Thiocapsa sp.]